MFLLLTINYYNYFYLKASQIVGKILTKKGSIKQNKIGAPMSDQHHFLSLGTLLTIALFNGETEIIILYYHYIIYIYIYMFLLNQ